MHGFTQEPCRPKKKHTKEKHMASASAVRIPSRTAEGKHTPRFIILKKAKGDEEFTRSYNYHDYYSTREAANAAAIEATLNFPEVEYKVRQK